jgi:hypothetical protein
MFMFRAFDMYVIKLLGGHPKEKHGALKHHTTFKVMNLLHCLYFLWLKLVMHVNCIS